MSLHDDWDSGATPMESVEISQTPDDGVQHLSKLPMLTAVVLLLASLVVLLLRAQGMESAQGLGVAGLAYLLTPLGVVGCVAWAQQLDARLRLNLWYDRKPGQLVLIRSLGALAFVVGFAHMWTIALFFARMFAGGTE